MKRFDETFRGMMRPVSQLHHPSALKRLPSGDQVPLESAESQRNIRDRCTYQRIYKANHFLEIGMASHDRFSLR